MNVWETHMIDAYAYGVSIRRDEFEGEVLFEGRVREFPDLFTYGETWKEAYELAIDALETLGPMLEEHGKPVPPPMVPVDDYRGRVTLRLPKSLHRALAMEAEAEGVSLNGYLVSLLSQFARFCRPR
jgi:predicted HicB family RNase H-like nuclease